MPPSARQILFPLVAAIATGKNQAKKKWFFRGICVDLRAGSGVSGALLAAVKRAAGINVGLCSP